MLGVSAGDVYAPSPLTVTALVVSGVPVHALSFGPYRLQVIVPVGLLPPLSVALSRTDPPIETPLGLAVVTSTGCAAAMAAYCTLSTWPSP